MSLTRVFGSFALSELLCERLLKVFEERNVTSEGAHLSRYRNWKKKNGEKNSHSVCVCVYVCVCICLSVCLTKMFK